MPLTRDELAETAGLAARMEKTARAELTTSWLMLVFAVVFVVQGLWMLRLWQTQGDKAALLADCGAVHPTTLTDTDLHRRIEQEKSAALMLGVGVLLLVAGVVMVGNFARTRRLARQEILLSRLTRHLTDHAVRDAHATAEQ